MTDDPLVEAYAECLRAMAAGADLAEALTRHPDVAAELRPLLEMADTLQAMAAPPMPRSTEMAARARFLTRVAGQLRGASAPRVAPLQTGRARLSVSALVLVVIMLGGSYGAVTVSAQSLPGDTLYGLKRSIESVRLWLASGAQERGELETEFEERRLEEVHALVKQQRTASIEFKGIITDLAATEWMINAIRVVVTPATRLSGVPRVGALAEVHGTLQSDGRVLAAEISLEAVEGEEVDDEEAPAEAQPPMPTATRQIPSTATRSPSSTMPASATAPVPTRTDPPAPSPSPFSVTATPTPAVSPTPVSSPTPTPPPAGGEEEVEFSGTIEAIAPEVWRIGGQDVFLTADSHIHGETPAIGMRAKVHALRLPDGRLVAREIEVKEASDDDHAADPSATPLPSSTPQP